VVNSFQTGTNLGRISLPKSGIRLALGLLSAAALSFAQVDYATATLKGIVLDPQDKIVAGAKVTAFNEATGATHTVVSNTDGYQILSLAPGAYRVEVAASGFARSVARDVVLTVGQPALYDVHLSLGTETSIVEVVADIPVVQPEQTQQSNIIDNVAIENLPNMTRSFVQSIYTLPGVNNAYAPALQNPGVGTGYHSSGFSVGASNGRNNLVTIDGGENDYGSGALRVDHVPIESIQEFQVNRNGFGAEFGFTIGTAINMVTKSGTNAFHGSGSGYFRDRATSAGNYFNKLSDPTHDPFEQTAIFGATLGGPIRPNRLFFFTAPEFQKLDSATIQNIAGEAQFQGIGAQSNGYNAASGSCPNQKSAQQQVTQLCYLTQLANAGGSLGAIGSALLGSPVFANPLSNPILNALVSKNDGTFDGILAGPAGSGARGVPGLNTPRGRYANWVSRIDYIPNTRDALAFRFSLMRETDDVSPAAQFSTKEQQRDYTLTGSWTRAIHPNLANTVRVQAVPSNTYVDHSPAPNGAEIDLGNQTQLGTPFITPYHARWRRFQFDENLSWITGSHSFKFGGSWRPDEYNARQKVWFGGQWQFADGAYSIANIAALGFGASAASALAAFNVSQGYPAGGPPSTNLTAVQSYLAGAPTVLLQADPNSNPQWSAWAHALGFFAQDSWKAAARLVVNYGIRFDYYRDPSPVPPAVRVSPRLGLAWDPAGNQKTVIRAGAGLFFAPTAFMIPFYANTVGVSGKYINQTALVAGLPSPPFPSIFAAWALQAAKASPSVPNPSFSASDLASLGVVIGPPGPSTFGNFIYTVPSDFQPAYTIQASFSVAREIARNLSLEAGYLMYRSLHIEQSIDINFVRNPAVPVDPFVGPIYMARPGFTAGEPNSSIFQNNALSSTGSGIYHGGVFSLTRRFDKGLQFQANYTFSRAIDDTSDFSSLSTPFRPDLMNMERGLSNFNITHNFVANAVYTTGAKSWLLSGITVSPILYARSGVPFTLLVPGLANGTIGHNSTARPWFEGRNGSIGPAFVSWDMRVSKAVVRGEGRPRIDVIAQAQNLLNRTNFAAVNGNFPADPNYPLPGGGTLGRGPYHVTGFAPTSISDLSVPLAYTAAYPARQISVALRIGF
jgi:hypothetical protein